MFDPADPKAFILRCSYVRDEELMAFVESSANEFGHSTCACVARPMELEHLSEPSGLRWPMPPAHEVAVYFSYDTPSKFDFTGFARRLKRFGISARRKPEKYRTYVEARTLRFS